MIIAVVLFIFGHIAAASVLKKLRTDELIHKDYHNISDISSWFGERFGYNVEEVLENESRKAVFSPNANVPDFQLTPFGNIKLGLKIGSSTSSTIFTIVGHGDLLIKFQANCRQLDSVFIPETPGEPYVHPLIRDYVFGNLAAHDGIGPEIHLISAPSPICETKTGKCAFLMADEFYEACRADPRSAMRYIVMRRVIGPTLFDHKGNFINGTVPFAESVLIGYGLIQFLRDLHQNRGVVHGDIHASNVMIESINTANGSLTLSLIDFGRSFYNQTRPVERIRSLGWSNHFLFTMWELDGFASAPRDDVARVVQAIAQLMHPWNYIKVEQYLGKIGLESLLEYKQRGDWFSLPVIPGISDDGFDVLATVPTEIRGMIRKELAKILLMVRGMNEVNYLPPYEEILSSLQKIFRLHERAMRATLH